MNTRQLHATLKKHRYHGYYDRVFAVWVIYKIDENDEQCAPADYVSSGEAQSMDEQTFVRRYLSPAT